jgi:hypothetical protein
MSDKKVEVTITSSISVMPETVQVKQHQDNVKWVNNDGKVFAIEIPGYDTPTCKAEGGKYVCISKTFPNEATIKYNVTSPGVPTLDPDIQVIP